MDLLGQYSDSDAEDQGPGAEATGGPAPVPRPQPQGRNAAPEADRGESHPSREPTAAPPSGLFNPFASPDTERTASNASASPSSGGKRGFTQVTGSGPLQDAPPKASRSAANPSGPKPAFNTALVPPQLRNGRANVSTEDVEKIFSKGTLAKRRPT